MFKMTPIYVNSGDFEENIIKGGGAILLECFPYKWLHRNFEIPYLLLTD